MITKTLRCRLMAASLLCAVTACATPPQPANDYALGSITEQHLMANFTAFTNQYQHHQLSEQQVQDTAKLPDDLSVTIYFATWCHDSQREVPRMLKALAAKPSINVELIALDYQKSDPEGRAKSADVHFTPTFIISRQNQEIGRIVERPKVDLIADISAMLAQH